MQFFQFFVIQNRIGRNLFGFIVHSVFKHCVYFLSKRCQFIYVVRAQIKYIYGIAFSLLNFLLKQNIALRDFSFHFFSLFYLPLKSVINLLQLVVHHVYFLIIMFFSLSFFPDIQKKDKYYGTQNRDYKQCSPHEIYVLFEAPLVTFLNDRLYF